MSDRPPLSRRKVHARKPTAVILDAVWQRGYLGHILRSRAGEVLGRVRRVGRPRVAYEWQTATTASQAPDLATAKRCVEQAVRTASVQPDLFVTPNSGRVKRRAPTWAVADSARLSDLPEA